MAGHTINSATVNGHINSVRDLAPKYWKGVSDLTVRNYLTYFNLMKYGSITYNARSHTQMWNARVKQPQIIPAIDGQPIEFVNTDTDIQFYIGMKGYRGTDYLPELEYLQAQGAPEQISDRYTRKSKELAQSMMERLSHSYYKDGNLAANVYDFVGLKTPLSYATGTVTAADKIAKPDGTYAGQSCALGNLGGTWSGDLATSPNANLDKDWPFGQGSSEYDGTSPLIVNYASTAWQTSATDWASNAIAATSYAQTAMLHRGGQSMVGAMPNVVMASEMFTEFKNSFRENNRQMMPFRDGDLGYPGETLMVDGMVYSMDYAVPTGEAYMYLPQYVEAFFVHNQIYGAQGPDYSVKDVGYLYYVSCYGNYKFMPKYLARFISKT
jgi:hypothetical protein